MAFEASDRKTQPVPRAPIDVASLPKAPLGQSTVLPAQAGVYFAIDNAHRIWYIGIAKSIRERIAVHDRMDDFRRSKVTAIAWKAEDENSTCRSIEKDLIEFYHPPLNCQNNFNKLPAVDLGFTPDQEIECFLRLRVQLKLIELELEALKPNLVSRCEQSGGKIEHRLGSIRCQTFKSWEYSEEVELLKLKLKKLQSNERGSGVAKVKAEKISPVARLNGDALSNGVATFLTQIEDEEELLEEAI
jgi:hypothetical protein